ncbi:MAG: TIGR00270 family protein [Thermoplasmata archaeon]|nr:MAG: TIGR00270 family protein [Thermoplasmata archaeon]RLF39888.1 MAG: TIGR00270 family protein [Thermoplasmata archaeon]
MQCELCGKETTSLKTVIIDGVEMMVCSECAVYGKVVEKKKEITDRSLSMPRKRIVSRVEDEIFKSFKKVLVPDWNEKIRKARMRKGLTREELGSKVGEPTVAIAKMENKELRPSDETIKKLEKVLGITLFQEVEEVHIEPSKGRSAFTIGDLIRMSKHKEE